MDFSLSMTFINAAGDKVALTIYWTKYNFINSKTVINCMNKELKQAKNKDFVKENKSISNAKAYELFEGEDE